jgi:hypothetical protein
MPRSTSAILVAIVAIFACAAGVSAQHHELHGSGTTNPSKFFWKVMDLLEERTRTPVTMTYRAVGTSRTLDHLTPRVPLTNMVTRRDASFFGDERRRHHVSSEEIFFFFFAR